MSLFPASLPSLHLNKRSATTLLNVMAGEPITIPSSYKKDRCVGLQTSPTRRRSLLRMKQLKSASEKKPAINLTSSHDLSPVQAQYYSDEDNQSAKQKMGQPSTPNLVAPTTKMVDYVLLELDETERDFQLDDELASSSHTATPKKENAGNYLSHILADKTEFYSLCDDLKWRMDNVSLFNIVQQALETFFDGLIQDATTELERKGSNLLRSHGIREGISRTILSSVNIHINRHSKCLAELGQEYGVSGGAAPKHDEEELSSILLMMKEISPNSKQLQIFLNSFRLLLLPQDLYHIVHSTATDDIILSSKQERSLVNQFKGIVEEYTLLDWNWWPLQPRMRPLNSDESRLIWYCACGTRLWKEISSYQAEYIATILSNPRSENLGPTQCICKRQESPLWKRIVTNIAYTVSAMSGGQQQAPASTTSPTASTTTQVQATGTAQPTITVPNTQPQQGTSSSNHPHPPSPTPSGSGSQSWILFGVQGARRCVELEHIQIDDHVNDGSFYRSLRTHYRNHRTKLKLWFSVWRFGFCDVVRFQWMGPNFVFGDTPDLPSRHSVDYEYDPKPPTAKNPLISHHEASMFLNCDSPCRWRIFHECVPELINRKTIERVPKRRSRFDIQSYTLRESGAWGLKAKHEVSAFRVAVYHVLILVPPFIFWGWWQSRHPNDLQNASVPATVAIGLLSFFWATSGILTQGRHLGQRSG